MADQHRQLRSVPWNVVDVAIATALVFAGFMVALFFLGFVADEAGVEERAVLAPWLTGILEGLMLVAVWAFAVRKYRVSWRTLGLRQPEGRWSFALPWAALGGSLAFTALYTWVVTRLGLDILQPPPIPDEALGEGIVRFLNIIVIALWGPFTEELFFRGFLLAALIAPLGIVRGSAVSAAVFSLAHLTIGTLIPIFVTGLLLAWLYIKTRSLWPPVVAHVAQNFLAVTATGVGQQGTAEHLGLVLTIFHRMSSG